MGALAVHHTATSGGPWDGPAAKTNLNLGGSESYYRSAFAWQDAEADPKTKAAYKFIHHEVDADGTVGAANLTGCSTGIGVLNGGMTGTTIPAADYRGVYNHLAAHLRDGKQEPPPLRTQQPGRVAMPRPIVATDTVTRTYPLERLEIRTGDGQPPRIDGYASVFNRLSEPLDDGWGFGFREKVAPGAFTKTLQFADVRALVNHDPNYVLGRNKSGTLSLAEDDHGLAVGIDPPATSWANDLMVSMQRGDVNQMSFGFRVIKDKWESIKDQNQRQDTRTLLEVALYDVSVVTFPAYKDTSAAVRSILADAGIDLDALSTLVARSQRGLELATDDHAVVRAAIAILTDFLPREAPPAAEPAPLAAHSEPVAPPEPPRTRHSLAGYKAWLERAERHMNARSN